MGKKRNGDFFQRAALDSIDQFATELRKHAQTLNLHGKERLEVEALVVHFFEKHYRDETVESVEIIYGVGRGVLRAEVHRVLAEYQKNGLIKGVVEAADNGSCKVIFDR